MKYMVLGHDGLDGHLSQACNLDYGKRGTFYPFRSIYKSTVPSWASIYTGETVDVHRFSGSWGKFLDRARDSVSLRDTVCVWHDIMKMGYTVGLFNMPLTYPPIYVNGWCVSGWPSPFNNFPKICRPRRIHNYLDESYKVDIFQAVDDVPTAFRRAHSVRFQGQKYIDVIEELYTGKLETLSRIIEHEPVDVLFLGFSFFDHAGHLTSHHPTLVPLLELADASIEMAYKMFKPERSIVVSDHGMDYSGSVSNNVPSAPIDHTDRATLLLQGFRSDLGEDLVRNEWDIKREIIGMLN